MVLSSSSFGSALSYGSFFSCSGEERFNWYCNEEKEEPKEVVSVEVEPVVQPTVAVQKDDRDPELIEFERIQEEMERLKRIAYVNPTEENLANYIAFQNMVTERASVFADVWQRTLWQNPHLDYSQKFPVAQMAKQTNLSMQRNERQNNINALREEGYGLFFFYSSSCPYCHQMEHPLKSFASLTGMDVLPVSIDGVLLEDKFPGSVIDQGQAAFIGVQQTPSIYLVNTKTQSIQPIATGWISTEDLAKRVFILTATEPGENY
jgi:conjugal transfer pilus assembly protein TraF